MFFSKSYTPLTFNETYIHKTISTKLQMYQENKSLTNIIFYGNNGTGKYILSQLLLESIFGPTIYKKKNYNDRPNYVYSNVHYEVYLSKTYDRPELKTFIKNLSNTKNVATDTNNIILIKNAHYLDKDIISVIKTFIEHENPIIFILIYNTTSSLQNSFKNMFYEVRIPNIKTNELKFFISTICTNEKIDITDETINDLIQMTEHNITKIMLNLQFFKQTNRFLTYSKTQIDDILELVYENKNENILKIREKLYTLTAKNFNKSFLINYALKKVLSKLTCQEKK